MGTAPSCYTSYRSLPVHPHVRGDGRAIRIKSSRSSGSPPRAWGRPAGCHRQLRQQRFTPTCVGTATDVPDAFPVFAVHPHVRGDGRTSTPPRRQDSGSPPRAWGRPWNSCLRTKVKTVHPHVRGDGRSRTATALPSIGSPPRAWGRLQPRYGERSPADGSPPRAWGRLWATRARRDLRRFTPTCVGTASALKFRTSLSAVHPHVRGDGGCGTSTAHHSSGSPPRAWGRPSSVRRPAGAFRFTPTCVGTAWPSLASLSWLPVHPHVRGDGVLKQGGSDINTGSPPRAWGRRLMLAKRLARLRFTPTCVGTARPARSASSRCTVHPHVRGDGVAAAVAASSSRGSPPRAWGRQGHWVE